MLYLHPFHLPFQSNVNDVSCKISVEQHGAFAIRVTSCDPQFFPLKRAYSGLRLWRCLSVNCCFSFTNKPKKISNTHNVQDVITPIQRMGGLWSVRSPIAQMQNQDEPDEYLAQSPVWLTILKLFRISQLQGITHFDQLNRKGRCESLTWRFIYPSVLTKNPQYSNPHFKWTNMGLLVSSWRNGLGLTGPTCWCFFFINENYQPVFGRRVDTHSRRRSLKRNQRRDVYLISAYSAPSIPGTGHVRPRRTLGRAPDWRWSLPPNIRKNPIREYDKIYKNNLSSL